jgi:hypothetical protein
MFEASAAVPIGAAIESLLVVARRGDDPRQDRTVALTGGCYHTYSPYVRLMNVALLAYSPPKNCLSTRRPRPVPQVRAFNLCHRRL